MLTERTLNFQKSAYLPHQWEFLLSEKPRQCLATGYGGGKTFIFLRKTLKYHIEKVNKDTGLSNGWIIYPNYNLGTELFVEPFCELLEKLHIDYDYNIAKNRIRTQFGTIRLFSLQVPKRMVGSSLTFCGCDEMDIESKPSVMAMYHKAIARLRGCDDAIFYTVSTVEGYKALYDLFFTEPSPEKHLIQASTTSNTHLPPGYVDSLRADYDTLMQLQYIDGIPQNLCGSRAYHTFTRDKHVIPCQNKDTYKTEGEKRYYDHPLWLGIDFNIEPMTATLSVLIDGKSYTFKEYHLRVGNTRGLMDLVRSDYPDRIILACPDMTGIARRTSASQSDIDIIKSYGCEVYGTYNKTQRDRLNIVNNIYEKGNAFIDPSCKHLIHDRERVIITDNQIDKTDPKLTHMSDGNDYMLIQQFKPPNTSYVR